MFLTYFWGWCSLRNLSHTSVICKLICERKKFVTSVISFNCLTLFNVCKTQCNLCILNTNLNIKFIKLIKKFLIYCRCVQTYSFCQYFKFYFIIVISFVGFFSHFFCFSLTFPLLIFHASVLCHLTQEGGQVQGATSHSSRIHGDFFSGPKGRTPPPPKTSRIQCGCTEVKDDA